MLEEMTNASLLSEKKTPLEEYMNVIHQNSFGLVIFKFLPA